MKISTGEAYKFQNFLFPVNALILFERYKLILSLLQMQKEYTKIDFARVHLISKFRIENKLQANRIIHNEI